MTTPHVSVTDDHTVVCDPVDLDTETAWQLLNALDAWHQADRGLSYKGLLEPAEQDLLNSLVDDARELLRVELTPKVARAFGWALVNAATVADRHRTEDAGGPAPMNVHPLLGKVL